MRISDGGLTALARAGQSAKRPIDTFRPAEPSPGVMPKGVKAEAVHLAADYDISATMTFAASGAWSHEGLRFPGFAYLSELTQRPEYRMLSETYAKEMTRKWIRLFGTDEDDDKSAKIKELEDELKRFKVRNAFRQMAEMDGFHGRGHLFVDFGDEEMQSAELDTPLVIDKRKISKGSLRGFTPVEPFWTYPAAYNASNPLKPDFFRPSSWYVMGTKVHRSRLLTFVSRELPNVLRPAYAFAGLSMSQMAKPYVDNWIRTRQSVSDTLNAFSIMVLATNMSAALDDGAMEDAVNRAKAFNLFRANLDLMEIDKETEELTNVSAPLGTLDTIQAQSQEQMASVSGIPLVKLLGTTPSGLNASSDGEIRVFYDRVHAYQEHLFADNLDKVLDIIQVNLWGAVDPGIAWEFVPLWQLDEAGEAAVRKTDADTDVELIDAGVIRPEEARRRLAGNPKSGYHGLDVDDVPEPPEDPEDPTLMPDPAKSAEPRSEERSGDRALDAWNEADHPRGQPENPGQFSSQSGGAALSVSKGATAGGAEASYDPASKSWSAPGVSPQRMKSLALPPAWKGVRVSHDEDAPLQAIGLDAKGRPQYRYSAAFAAGKAAEKFVRITALESKQNAINEATKADTSDTAASVRLMYLTGMRPGSETDTGAEKKAHGATNLRKSHVQVDGDTIHYDFVGKEGVQIKNSVTDPELAKVVSARLKVDDGERLFNTTEIKARQFIKSLVGGDFKSKDLRTLRANLLAAATVAGMDAPKTEKERRSAVNRVGDVVSSQLGNTRAMALSSYINPVVFAAWETNMMTPDKATDAKESTADMLARQGLAWSQFAASVSYGDGKITPKMADADDDDGND